MKKVLFAVIALISAPIISIAANDMDVRFTVHNLSNNNDPTQGLDFTQRNYMAAATAVQTEVCVFCHTPHNASPAVPLWNKVYAASTATTFKLYTSSATLTNTAKRNSSITADSPSMLCLSCHDGKTAINILHNSKSGSGVEQDANDDYLIRMNGNPFGAVQPKTLEMAGTVNSMNIGAERDSSGNALAGQSGTNLQDDHPLGFSYSDAQAESPSRLHTVNDAKTSGIRFFGPNNRLECSSCHNPHRFYGYGRSGGSRVSLTGVAGYAAAQKYTPFLVRDNDGSALCLSCHIK